MVTKVSSGLPWIGLIHRMKSIERYDKQWGGLGLNLFTGSSENKNYYHMQGFSLFQKNIVSQKKSVVHD